MYQPAHGRFTVSDPAAVLADLLERSPATLVTASAAGFRTTILPMLVERAGEGAADPIDVSADPDRHVLRGHIARGNPQWRDLEDGASAVAIVLGPDAYVTPAWYAEKRRTGKVVPTWNYTAVSAHGTLRIRHEPEWLLAHVRTLVDRHERTRREPWSVDDAPPDFVATQARAIVGIELLVDRIDAKRKLSQNRSAEDVASVVAGLSGGSPAERAVADDMRAQAAKTP